MKTSNRNIALTLVPAALALLVPATAQQVTPPGRTTQPGRTTTTTKTTVKSGVGPHGVKYTANGKTYYWNVQGQYYQNHPFYWNHRTQKWEEKPSGDVGSRYTGPRGVTVVRHGKTYYWDSARQEYILKKK